MNMHYSISEIASVGLSHTYLEIFLTDFVMMRLILYILSRKSHGKTCVFVFAKWILHVLWPSTS